MERQTILLPNGTNGVSDSQAASQNPHPTETTSVQRKRAWWTKALPLVLAGVLGATAGFAASGLHPGPEGKQGNQGVAGVAGATGPMGPAGAAGSAAQVTGLGVCVSENTASDFYGQYFVNGMSIFSPSKHADGTTYCASGQYVPVAPQSPQTNA
jgi:hypothetical protein